MIRVYDCPANEFRVLHATDRMTFGEEVVWIDADRPTDAEEEALESALKLDLPTADEMKDIEPSSRLYTESGALFMTAGVLWGVDSGHPQVAPITFVLANGRLITVRYVEPRTFRTAGAYIQSQPQLRLTGVTTLIMLLEGIVDRTAEVLETVGANVDRVGKEILQRKQRAKRMMASTRGLKQRSTQSPRTTISRPRHERAW